MTNNIKQIKDLNILKKIHKAKRLLIHFNTKASKPGEITLNIWKIMKDLLLIYLSMKIL